MKARAKLPGGEVAGRLVGFDPERDMLTLEVDGEEREAPMATAVEITVAGFDYSKAIGTGQYWTRLGSGERSLGAGINDAVMRKLLGRSLG